MVTKIFVNLPVKDLRKSMEFFSRLGYSFNPQFTDEKAACMVISDGCIYAMLIIEPFFQTFTKKKIADAQTSTEVLIALDAQSREEVNETVKKAVAAGGSVYREPEDHGWMYGHSFADLDGHQWEVLYMDEAGIAGTPPTESVGEATFSKQ
ncbi:MAG TPA: VOC family protein [Flavipsychrobacter sp.]|jgi:predicted lactoylglutathione lyase|nr:VOC family protein [Flavipsychrobacter sp.]